MWTSGTRNLDLDGIWTSLKGTWTWTMEDMKLELEHWVDCNFQNLDLGTIRTRL